MDELLALAEKFGNVIEPSPDPDQKASNQSGETYANGQRKGWPRTGSLVIGAFDARTDTEQ